MRGLVLERIILCGDLVVPGAGIEPAQPQGPRDFKSLASTSSATQASFIVREIYMLSGNVCQGIHFSGFISRLVGVERASPDK